MDGEGAHLWRRVGALHNVEAVALDGLGAVVVVHQQVVGAVEALAARHGERAAAQGPRARRRVRALAVAVNTSVGAQRGVDARPQNRGAVPARTMTGTGLVWLHGK